MPLTPSIWHGVLQPYLGSLVMFWGVLCTHLLQLPPVVPFDSFRDLAYTQSVLNGRSIWSDPTILGESIWYPPLNPLFFLFLNKISGLSVEALYSWSPLFINVFAPVLLWILVWQMQGAFPATCAALLIPMMPWLRTHLFRMGMPSIHSFTVVLAVLIPIIYFLKKGITRRSSVMIGICLGFALLHHTLSGGILYAAILLWIFTALLQKRLPLDLWTLIPLTLIPIAMVARFIIPNFIRAKLNLAPIEYIAPELFNPEWYLYIPNMYIFPLTLALLAFGVFELWHKHLYRDAGLQFICCIIVVTIVGQVLGYSRFYAWRLDLGPNWEWLRHVPILIPHEFQWFFQLFTLPIIAIGILGVADIRPQWRIPIALTFLLSLTIPSYRALSETYKLYPFHDARVEQPFITWIKGNTDLNAVFASNDNMLSFVLLQPKTARPIVFHSPGHMNYNVDVALRDRLQQELIDTADTTRIKDIAQQLQIKYLLIVTNRLKEERVHFFRSTLVTAYQDNEITIFDIGRAM